MLALSRCGLPIALLLAPPILAQDPEPPQGGEAPSEVVVFVADEEGEPIFKAYVSFDRTDQEREELREKGITSYRSLGGQTDPLTLDAGPILIGPA